MDTLWKTRYVNNMLNIWFICLPSGGIFILKQSFRSKDIFYVRSRDFLSTTANISYLYYLLLKDILDKICFFHSSVLVEGKNFNVEIKSVVKNSHAFRDKPQKAEKNDTNVRKE